MAKKLTLFRRNTLLSLLLAPAEDGKARSSNRKSIQQKKRNGEREIKERKKLDKIRSKKRKNLFLQLFFFLQFRCVSSDGIFNDDTKWAVHKRAKVFHDSISRSLVLLNRLIRVFFHSFWVANENRAYCVSYENRHFSLHSLKCWLCSHTHQVLADILLRLLGLLVAPFECFEPFERLQRLFQSLKTSSENENFFVIMWRHTHSLSELQLVADIYGKFVWGRERYFFFWATFQSHFSAHLDKLCGILLRFTKQWHVDDVLCVALSFNNVWLVELSDEN